ncbi:mCG146186, partial [Mus musculus]
VRPLWDCSEGALFCPHPKEPPPIPHFSLRRWRGDKGLDKTPRRLSSHSRCSFSVGQVKMNFRSGVMTKNLAQLKSILKMEGIESSEALGQKSPCSLASPKVKFGKEVRGPKVRTEWPGHRSDLELYI